MSVKDAKRFLPRQSFTNNSKALSDLKHQKPFFCLITPHVHDDVDVVGDDEVSVFAGFPQS